ncbi:MAG TPA: hypothetical protein VLL94_10720, partial [Nitrospiraceae bacterium]|nr:hypothetical protein [Nitrospiraceae bacterium]
MRVRINLLQRAAKQVLRGRADVQEFSLRNVSDPQHLGNVGRKLPELLLGLVERRLRLLAFGYVFDEADNALWMAP